MLSQIIDKSSVTRGLLAFVLVSKFCDAIPFYRQETQFARIGIDLPRGDFCNWTAQAALQCDPLMELFLDEIRAGPVMQMDETRVQVMKELGRADTAQSFRWVMRGGPPEKPVILYRYHPSRSAAIPLQYLFGFHGHLQTDGYEGYAEVGSLRASRMLAAGLTCGASSMRRQRPPRRAAALMKLWRGSARSTVSSGIYVPRRFPQKRLSRIAKTRFCRFSRTSSNGSRRKLSRFRHRTLDEMSSALAQLTEANKKLVTRIQVLEEKINKDSHNSNKPPSSDGLVRGFSRKRQPSGEKPGGQKGHEGTTLSMVKHPQYVQIHEVKACHDSGKSLQREKPRGYEARQVFDIPPIVVEVTEHRGQIKRCLRCGKLSIAAFPEGVNHRTQYGTRLKARGVSRELRVSLLRQNRSGVRRSVLHLVERGYAGQHRSALRAAG